MKIVSSKQQLIEDLVREFYSEKFKPPYNQIRKSYYEKLKKLDRNIKGFLLHDNNTAYIYYEDGTESKLFKINYENTK